MPLSKQEIYSNALFGIRGQNYERSATVGGRCVYKAKQGLKCALGHSIPDEAYSPDYEGMPTESVVRDLAYVFGDTYLFCRELQAIHDQRLQGGSLANLRLDECVADWEGRMHLFAQEHGLQYTPA